MKNYSSLNGKECHRRWVSEYKAARLVALAIKTDRSGTQAELRKAILSVRRMQKGRPVNVKIPLVTPKGKGVPDGLSM